MAEPPGATDHGRVSPAKRLAELERENAALRARLKSYETRAKAFHLSPFWATISTLDDWRYLEVNQAFLDGVGLGRHEVLGHTSLELGTWPNPQTRHEIVNQLLAQKTVRNLEVKRRVRSGRIVDTLYSGELLEQDGQRLLLSISQDISHLALTETALRESERKFRRIVETANEGIWVLDAQGRVIFANPKMTAILGLPAQEMLGRLAQDFMHPDERGDHRRQMERRRQGLHDGYERRLVDGQGREVWTWVSASPMFDPMGEFTSSFAMFTDITPRKQAEAEAKEAQARFGLLVESAPDGVFVQTNHRFAYINQVGARMLGAASPRELLGRPVLERFDPSFHAVVRERIRQLNEEKIAQPAIEQIWLRLDGTPIPVEVSAVPINWGGHDGAMVFFRDISERKLADVALRQSEEKFRLAFQTNPDAICLTRAADGCFLDVNDGFCEIAGFGKDELIAKSSLAANIWVDPEDRRKVVEALAAHGRVVDYEARFRHKSGRIITGLMSAAILPLAGETCILSITKDIEERKRAEREKTKLEAQLRQAQKMEAIGTLSGGIAHDFNNILGAVMGFSELALEANQRGEACAQEITHVIKAAERACGLVRQILTFSRNVEANLRPVNLNKEVFQAVAVLERTLPKMIAIETHLQDDIRYVEADANQIEQIILNLATNASHAMPDGGSLVLETANATLDDDYCRQHLEVKAGDYVLLQVSDTGCGMDQKTREQIFDPFFTTKEVGQGTGLGLSMVFGIVKSHRGHIYCYSEPGLGTVFKIYLPAYQSQGEERDATRPARVIPGGNETILLVDDETTLRELGQKILGRAGYKVMVATSGEEALAVYGQTIPRPDMVLMDLGMPGMGGNRCLRQLLEADPKVKVLIASGYSANGQVKDSLRAGAAGFIAKPFRREELLLTVRRVLDEAR